jgi:hypothetical protein
MAGEKGGDAPAAPRDDETRVEYLARTMGKRREEPPESKTGEDEVPPDFVVPPARTPE